MRMLKSKLKSGFIGIAALFAATTAWAGTFTFNEGNSTVAFTTEHTIGFNFGVIQKFSGTIVVDEQSFTIQDIQFSCDMASLTTFNKRRDEVLKSDKFFDVTKYPQAQFAFKKIGKDKITADVTINGKTVPVEFDYRFWGVAKNSNTGEKKAALQMVGHNLKRADFGLDYNVLSDDGQPLLGEDIHLILDLVGVLK